MGNISRMSPSLILALTAASLASLALPASGFRGRRQALNPSIVYKCPFVPLNTTECDRADRQPLTECTAQSQCAGDEYCCLGGKYGCDFVCTKPIMPELVHSGVCPKISMSLL